MIPDNYFWVSLAPAGTLRPKSGRSVGCWHMLNSARLASGMSDAVQTLAEMRCARRCARRCAEDERVIRPLSVTSDENLNRDGVSSCCGTHTSWNSYRETARHLPLPRGEQKTLIAKWPNLFILRLL